MELVCLERRNRLHGNSATPEFSGRSEDHHQLQPDAAPEVQSDLVQVNYRQPLATDEKKSMSCQSCQRLPCSCGDGVPCSDLCPALPAIPAKMMILEYLIRSLRHPTRTHNVSDLDDMISGRTSTGDVTLGPSEKMMMDSLHALVNTKTRPKSPSFYLSGAKMRKTRSRSHIVTQSEILKLISPETWEISSLGVSPLRKSTAELCMDAEMAPSFSDTARMSASEAVLSSYPSSSSLSAGLLQCIWKDGLPHFELSLDSPMAVYAANPIKAHDNDKALDYVYLFHSGEPGKKDWMGNSSNVSKLVGKMKVSSSLVLSSGQPSSMQTEFVLYGSPDDYLRQMQSTYSVTKGKGLVQRVAEIMKSPNVYSSPKHAWKFSKPSPQQFDDMREMLGGEVTNIAESSLVSLTADDLPTNQEIAAIVVREQRHERQEEPAVGGWGLKFLEKAGAVHSEESKDSKGAARSITAIVPRGYHGGVASKNGPSGLIERWRTGGRCNCGGWDLGCPIRVLNNDGGGSLSPQSAAYSQESKSAELSMMGVRRNHEPVLRLVNVAEDLYILYFESTLLSPLQCFSTDRKSVV